MTIDNGNHLLLSGNHAALDYLRSIGAEHRLIGPPHAEFSFRRSRERRALDAALQRRPVAVLDFRSDAPRAGHARARLSAAGAACSGRRRARRSAKSSPAKARSIERLVEPLLLAALNIDAPHGSARLAGAIIRETLAVGGRACRPLIAREGLGTTLIEPALACCSSAARPCAWSISCARCVLAAERVEALDFGGETDRACAPTMRSSSRCRPMPPPRWCAGLTVPTEFRAIVNAHFRIEPPAAQPPILGVLNGTVQWLFAFPGRLSVTISAGDRLIDTPREELAKRSGARSRGLPDCRPRCRGGRSCASAAPPSRRRRRKMPSVPGRCGGWPFFFFFF